MNRLAWAGGLALLLSSPIARAEEPGAVEIRAEKAEGDLALTDVELSGDVRISAGKARLRADRLRLRRFPDGSSEVIGPARLALCPCEDPPVDFVFDRASLDASGGVVLHGGALRLGGHEALPVPWLALRSERQLGLLPPAVSYRGSDGWVAGAGVHVPVMSQAHLDLTPSVYLAGGHELIGKFHSAELEATARWDHRGGDLVAVDARADVPLSRGRLTADVDAIRGARGRSGTVDIDAAARAYDRAAVTLLVDDGLSVGVRSSAPRGDVGAVTGPRISFVRGWALGSSAQSSLIADASSLADARGEAIHVARMDAGVSGGLGAGPIVLRAEARAGSLVIARPDGAGTDVWTAASLVAGTPLARRYGDVVHVIEPRLLVPAILASATGDLRDPLGRPLAVSTGSAAVPGFGLETRLGPSVAPFLVASLDAGTLVSAGAPRAVSRALAHAGSAVISFDAESAALGRQGGFDGFVVVADGSVGRGTGPRWDAGVEGRRGVDPIAARALAADVSPFGGGWLASEGWSAHTGATIPVVRWLSLGGAAFADLSSRELLGERGSLVYHHVCGCLRLGAIVSHRLARGGVDASLSIDLAPR